MIIASILNLIAQADPDADVDPVEFDNCDDKGCLSTLPNVDADAASIENILAVVFGVFAAVAVLIIILAAIDFSSSEGDSEKISRAKKTIIYALIGLAIALSAEFIIFTVLGRL